MNAEKLMIFIDGSNLFHSQRRYSESIKKDFRVDIVKLKEKFSQDYNFVRAYYFCSTPIPPIKDQTAFYDSLEYQGIRVIKKPLQYRYNPKVKRKETKEKGVDVALATELMASGLKKSYDLAIIISGDKDYETAIKYVQSEGVKVHVYCFKNSLSDELKRVADKWDYLDKFVNDIEYK